MKIICATLGVVSCVPPGRAWNAGKRFKVALLCVGEVNEVMAENLRPAQGLAVDVCTVCLKTLKERSVRERLIFKSSGSVLDVRELKNSAYAGDYRRITYETNTATIVGTLQSCMRDMVLLHPNPHLQEPSHVWPRMQYSAVYCRLPVLSTLPACLLACALPKPPPAANRAFSSPNLVRCAV